MTKIKSMPNFDVQYYPDFHDLINPIEKPAKLWRNWYFTKKGWTNQPNCLDTPPNSVYPGINLFPTKELAEEAYLKLIKYEEKALNYWQISYLGAFPDGVTPR